jgi:hypothetical protein
MNAFVLFYDPPSLNDITDIQELLKGVFSSKDKATEHINKYFPNFKPALNGMCDMSFDDKSVWPNPKTYIHIIEFEIDGEYGAERLIT